MRLGEMTTEEVRALPRAPADGGARPRGQRRAARAAPAAGDRHALSETAATARLRRARGARDRAVVAPSVAYGVTDFAEGFAGAVSVPAERADGDAAGDRDGASRAAGCTHVCLVSNHLEPAHDAAVRAAVGGDRGRVGRVAAHATLGAHAERRVQARRLPRRPLRDVARPRRRRPREGRAPRRCRPSA